MCRYAAVFAALVVGLACLVGIDFGAKLLASLAKCFEVPLLFRRNYFYVIEYLNVRSGCFARILGTIFFFCFNKKSIVFTSNPHKEFGSL